MNAEKLKLGIVGVGKMGQFHLSKFLNIPEVCVEGIYDTNTELANKTAAEKNTRVYTSLEELLFEVDAVVIASITATHYLLAKKALELGVHVLVEKPICLSEKEALELCELATKNNLILQVGLLERFRLRRLLEGAAVNSIRYIHAERHSKSFPREKTIDAVEDLMIHDLDMAISIFKEEPMSVRATGNVLVNGVIDSAIAWLEFSNGRTAVLEASFLAGEVSRKFNLFGASNIYLNMMENIRAVYTSGHLGGVEINEKKIEAVDPLAEQSHAFIESIKNSKRPLVNGVDGTVALKFSLMIKNKIRNNFNEGAIASPSSESQIYQ